MSQMTDNASGTCPHIAESSLEPLHISHKFKSMAVWNLRYSHSISRPAKRRKVGVPNEGICQIVRLTGMQLAAPTCGTCDSPLPRPFACLRCSYSGCWRDGHVKRHLEETGHTLCTYLFHYRSVIFASGIIHVVSYSTFMRLCLPCNLSTLNCSIAGVDVKTGSIFCSECGDFVYDSGVNSMFAAATITTEEKNTSFRGTASRIGALYPVHTMHRWDAMP